MIDGTETPVLSEHDGITVVRDDMYPGGTKARFLHLLYKPGIECLVYATPPQGGAQTALAYTAQRMGKRAHLFVARRSFPHARTLMAATLGAELTYVKPGYLNVVQKRAFDWAQVHPDAYMVPFGCDVPEAMAVLASAARRVPFQPDEVWCAGGSGVLARALALAWPNAVRHVVQVGRELSPLRAGQPFRVHMYPRAFEDIGPPAPFPADPHYDAKAFNLCKNWKRPAGRRVLFWNVTGPASC